MSETPRIQKSKQEVINQMGRIARKLHRRVQELPDGEVLPVPIRYAGTAEAPIHLGTQREMKRITTSDGTILVAGTDHSAPSSLGIYMVGNNGKMASHEVAFGSEREYFPRTGKSYISRHAKTQSTVIDGGYAVQSVVGRLPHKDYRGEWHAEPEIVVNAGSGAPLSDTADTAMAYKPKIVTEGELVRHANSQAAETMSAIRGSIAQAEIEAKQRRP